MSVAAIIGAGDRGAAIAHRLAVRAAFREIRLIDERTSVAAGKALDIIQSGPVDQFETRVVATDDVLSASGAAVIVVADALADGEWQDERGLRLVEKLLRAGTNAPFVFSGPNQVWLMETAAAELRVSDDRLVGTAASALVGAARALVALELDRSATDVELTVVGRPPALVIGWSAATLAGTLVTDLLPAHRLLAISDRLKRLWPPGPQSTAAATAPVAEALAFGSRRLHQALTVLDGELGARGIASMLPLSLGRGRVLARIMPSLSPVEKGDGGVFHRF